MHNTEELSDDQAIEVALSRARLALQLAMSHERPITIWLRYEHGEITFGLRLDVDHV